MKTLEFIQERKKNGRMPLNMPDERGIGESDDLISLFPLPRYFQVHFQHVHENSQDIQAQMAQLKLYVMQVDAKLDRLMALLDTSCIRQDE